MVDRLTIQQPHAKLGVLCHREMVLLNEHLHSGARCVARSEGDVRREWKGVVIARVG